MASSRRSGRSGADVPAAGGGTTDQQPGGLVDSLLSGWAGWGGGGAAEEALKPRARPVSAVDEETDDEMTTPTAI